MPLSNFKYNNDGVVRRASGSLSGTYTAATVVSESVPGVLSNSDAVKQVVIAAGVMTITLGWVPKKFKITNLTDRLTQEWAQGMNTGDFLETVAAGTRTLETDDQISVNPTTGVVTVTFAGGAVTDNDTVVWEAEG